jgi:hypothetical protein
MDRPSFLDWQQLAHRNTGPCGTIYLPTFPGRPEEFEDHIRLKNLTGQVREDLIAHGMCERDASAFAVHVLSLPAEKSFWHDRSRGLAIFSSPGIFHTWRLPIAFSEFAYVGTRFQLAPLLTLFTEDQSYFVLGLSRNGVRLFKGSRHQFLEISGADFPAGVSGGMNYAAVSGGGQIHSGASAILGKRSSVHHGQGGVADFEHDEFVSYLRVVNAKLTEKLQGSKDTLLLAATKSDITALRDVLTYEHVLDHALEGNCEHLSLNEIHNASWDAIEKVLAARQAGAIAEFRDLAHTKRASHEPSEIIPAAIQGRIKTLFVDRGARLWGEFDDTTQTIRTHADRRHDDDDLFDRAVVETALQHGNVYQLDKKSAPSASPISAIFRY